MSLSRRRFLSYTAALAAAGGASWWAQRRLNTPPTVNVRRIGMDLGHRLRDRNLPLTARQTVDCPLLILGSGAAALTAAWYLAKHGRRDFWLAEGVEADGNNAAFRFQNLLAPSGAHYLAPPSAESGDVRDMLRDFGILQADGRYRETDLVHAPEERLLYRGQWQESLLPVEDADSRRFAALIEQLKTLRGQDGRKVFAIPVALSSADASWRALDQITFAQWLDRERYASPTLRWYLDYCCRDDYGQGLDTVSAFAGLHYFAARGHDLDTVLTWPEGLAHLSQQLRRHSGLRAVTGWPAGTAGPSAVDASAIHIREQDDHVRVLLRHNRSGDTVAVRAQQVICAMPLFVAARLLEQAAAYGFQHPLPESAPWLVGNFVLRGFPAEIGDHELAWDNVVHASPALGYVVASHQWIRVAKPEHTVFTTYAALNHDAPRQVRHWLQQASDQTLIEHAAQDLVSAYGRRFWRQVMHIDLAVRAHGMSIPTPGYLNRPLTDTLRRHRSRICFAHSDLSGYSVFEEAVYWGAEAARAVLAGS